MRQKKRKDETKRERMRPKKRKNEIEKEKG
jgi:hypothetical protein